MTRRTYLMAVLGAPTLSPLKVKKVVADLSEQTLTTTYEPFRKEVMWAHPLSSTRDFFPVKESK